MAHSHTEIYIHIVFTTKIRESLIPPEMKKELYLYISGILKFFKSNSIIINGIEDHIHILCKLSKNVRLSEIVYNIKRDSSKWMKQKGISNFYWQNGYSAFSVGPSELERMIKYISSQEIHHKQHDIKICYNNSPSGDK